MGLEECYGSVALRIIGIKDDTACASKIANRSKRLWTSDHNTPVSLVNIPLYCYNNLHYWEGVQCWSAAVRICPLG